MMKRIVSKNSSINEVLNQLNLDCDKIKKNTKKELLNDIYEKIKIEYPISCSNGGVNYGFWFKIGIDKSIKISIKLKRTDKLKKISKTKNSYIYEFDRWYVKEFDDKQLNYPLIEIAKELGSRDIDLYYEIIDLSYNIPSLNNELLLFNKIINLFFYNRIEFNLDKKYSDIGEELIKLNRISSLENSWGTIYAISNFYDILIGCHMSKHKLNLYGMLYKKEYYEKLYVSDIINTIIKAREIGFGSHILS